MKYVEEKTTGNKYREEYLSTLKDTIKRLQNEADKRRAGNFKNILANPDKYRNDLKEMLGWPLNEYDAAVIPNAHKELVVSEDGMNIYRVQVELPIGIKFYGIYFEHNNGKKLPLIISQHGGEGTPELCSDMLERGSMNYNKMTLRVFNKGVNVFAPQLLIWSEEGYGIKHDRWGLEVKLKQLGSSIAAIEIYGIMKCIDYLCTLDTIDKEHIGMTGMSYGGFYTLFTTAIDTRIKAAFASSQYNSRYKYSWRDWTWFNSANKFLDNEVAALVYPRYLAIAVGDNDEVFDCDAAVEEYKKMKELMNGDSLFDFTTFPGVHEYMPDDKFIDNVINAVMAD